MRDDRAKQDANSRRGWIVQKDKDLRIKGATPKELARRIVSGGVPRRKSPRPEERS